MSFYQNRFWEIETERQSLTTRPRLPSGHPQSHEAGLRAELAEEWEFGIIYEWALGLEALLVAPLDALAGYLLRLAWDEEGDAEELFNDYEIAHFYELLDAERVAENEAWVAAYWREWEALAPEERGARCGEVVDYIYNLPDDPYFLTSARKKATNGEE